MKNENKVIEKVEVPKDVDTSQIIMVHDRLSRILRKYFLDFEDHGRDTSVI